MMQRRVGSRRLAVETKREGSACRSYPESRMGCLVLAKTAVEEDDPPVDCQNAGCHSRGQNMAVEVRSLSLSCCERVQFLAFKTEKQKNTSINKQTKNRLTRYIYIKEKEERKPCKTFQRI